MYSNQPTGPRSSTSTTQPTRGPRGQRAPGGGVQSNPAQSTQQLGVSDRDDDWGGRINLGDGFSGLDFSYLNLDQKSSNEGVLTSDFGGDGGGRGGGRGGTYR